MSKPEHCSTLKELLEWRSRTAPNSAGHVFLTDGKTEQTLSYQLLDEKARSIASELLQVTDPGQPVLIHHNPGLDYVCALFGCLYAGMVAVPVYPPRFNQKLDRLLAIISDLQPKVCLTSRSFSESLSPLVTKHSEIGLLRWLITEDISASTANTALPEIGPESLAILQYTSGSTSSPKGVMLSHGNLVDNLDRIHGAFDADSGWGAVSWLPPYHDMGLIGTLISPIYCGFTSYLMSPYTFLMRPFRWLEAISKYKVSFSGGPNFAYELCTRRLSEAQVAKLDLSSWKLAFCGAEPIHADVLERFYQKFSVAGFKREAFFPCYGLAEVSLMITGGIPGKGANVTHVDSVTLETQGLAQPVEPSTKGARALVSCGKTVEGHRLRVINPKTHQPCTEGQVGEIWVSGPSVAKGYWQKKEATEKAFAARVEGDTATYLRTGDLGFQLAGELYVTGRIKDLLIINGRNLYPQDIERTVAGSHPAVKGRLGAAVSVLDAAKESMIIIQEVDRREGRAADLQEVCKAIQDRVSEAHGVSPTAISLIRENSIPLTSSGKIQRHATRNRYLSGELNELTRYSR